MTSIKVKLWKHKEYSDGSHPVRLEVIHERKRAVQTLFNIQSEFWDEGNHFVKPDHPDSSRLNKKITGELSKAFSKLDELEKVGGVFEAKDLLYAIDNSSLLVDVIDDFLDDFDHRSVRRYNNLSTKIKEFKPNVVLGQIDEAFMKRFKQWLQDQESIKSNATVGRYLKTLKTVLRRQENKGNYSNAQVFAFPASEAGDSKIALTKKEFEKIEKLDNNALALTRDCFVLQFYLRGVRIGDMMQMRVDHLIDGRFIFTEQKTGKQRSIKIPAKGMEIVNRYAGQSVWGYILPILTHPPADPKTDKAFAKHIETRTTIINRELKIIAAAVGINKNLSTHVSRHTFGSIAYKELNSYSAVQTLIGHKSARTTENYIKNLIADDEADDLADKVFG